MMGTYQLASDIGAPSYTLGRDYAIPALQKLVRDNQLLAVDIETYGLGLDARHIKCVQFADDNSAVILDPRDPAQEMAIQWALRTLRWLAFHKSSFDVPNLCVNGLMDLESIAKVWDVLIYARMAEPDERTAKSLGKCAERWLGFPPGTPMEKVFRRLGMTKKEGFYLGDINQPLYVERAAIDPILTFRLLPIVRKAAYLRTISDHPFTVTGVKGEEAKRLVDREQRINRLLLRRSARGLRVDLGFLDRFQDGNRAAIGAAQDQLVTAGIAPGNGASLAKFLDGLGAFPPGYPRTPKTKAPSTQAKHLEALSHPMAQTFVQHKQLTKIQDDYLEKIRLLELNGRVHPSVDLLAATTGRMSMSDPPFQQFPAPARGIVLADERDSLTSIDWSQIEPVVIANIAKDMRVLRGYEDGTSDLYTDIGGLARVDRKVAKVIVLAQMYGEGMEKLAGDLGVTLDRAYELRTAVFSAMPMVKRLIWQLRDIGEKHLKVFTLSGRILTVPSGSDWVATHKAVNYFVQGSAYDVLAEALIRIEEAGLGDAVYLAMHDELIVSSSVALEIEMIMRQPPERLCFLAGRTPVLRTDLVELGERWAAA
jgi:DNA polymerase-1